MTIVYADGRCKLMADFFVTSIDSLLGSESKERMRNNESANNRTINLFRPEVKSSLQMSGVKNSQELY